MPELPEVETILRGLAPVIEGQIVTTAKVNRPDLRWPFPKNMANRLIGKKIKQLRRRSKYILADLSCGQTLLFHLGMSGRILVTGDQLGRLFHVHSAPEKHDHVVLDFSNGARITFNDPRRFGAMDLFDTDKEHDCKMLANLGPEPLGNSFNPRTFAEQVKKRRSPIKSVLLDQRIIAGLGNIYVCETLYRAAISPTKFANIISQKRLEALVPHIRDVLLAAISAGGSSLRDFKQTNGDLGYFQHSFDVYGRENEPCRRAACNGKVSRVVQSGRSSFYCKVCQK
ncbi:MAG: DNA-formamidopyrimidine glycosylase [Rhodobacteraceae bacterium]|nr:DNA-formamidopyrimidine glycosylase [Paracoccaceae bacterium]